MRSHAKASSAGSTQRQASGLGRICIALLACLAMAVVSATPAHAVLKEDWKYDFSIDGTGSTAGKFQFGLVRIGIDQSTGYLYALDMSPGVISKFDADGNPVNFSSTGTSSLTGAATPQGSLELGIGDEGDDITIDNSGGPNQGRIYVNGEAINAFGPSGEYLWQIPPSFFPSDCGTATDKNGFLWVGDLFGNAAFKFDKAGSPPALLDQVDTGQQSICRLNLDASGNLYVIRRASRVDKYVNGEFDSTLDPKRTEDIAIDQSSPNGRLYTVNNQSFTEFNAAGVEIGNYGEGKIGSGTGIAYYKALDRIYVADNSESGDSLIEVFKHVVGTAPDATLGPVSNITATSALLSGTVNPQGVNNDYHFEWKERSQTWAEAQSSPAQVLPVDSSDHAVSYEATGLSAETAYEFRIVARNTDLDLTSISAVGSFGNIAVEAIGRGAAPRADTSARLNGFVNPGGNPAKYHFEYSTDGINWTPLPEGDVAASADPVPVSSELGGLQQSSTYRYRLIAETLLGSDQSDEVLLHTRSSAELVLPERGIEMVSNAEKGTQNAYAFGPFDTTSALSADGNQVLWTVTSGAPGSNTGTQAAFLAQRTSGGWQSKSLVPPAAQQVGEGRFTYRVESATPDFSKFVFLVAKSDVFLSAPESVVRLDAGGNQDALTTYNESVNESAGLAAEISDDGAHIVAINTDTEQLEELGSGTPEVVSLMPDGNPSECGFALYENGGPAVGFKGPVDRGAGASWRPGYRRIAATDGSRIYFEVSPNGNCNGARGLYVRNRDSEETTLIDPGAGGTGINAKHSQVIRVTPDGRQAYFSTYSQLDPADTNASGDIYRWEEEADSSTCLTCEANPDIGMNSGTSSQPAALVSDDFSRAYFVSPKALAPGAVQGLKNIYSLSDGEIHFVAKAATIEEPLRGIDRALLSSDGSVLTFVGQGGITTDAVAENCNDPLSGSLRACRELYRYDERDESVECLSCAHGITTTHTVGSPYILAQASDFKMSGDGGTVAFVTAEKLVPLDVNNDSDIYEWRNGALRLITDGVTSYKKGTAALQVRALDEDGTNLLFSGAAPGLTGFEHDGLASVYDARIGGGFEPPAPAVHCVEESCQGPLKPVPHQDAASSAAFAGRGNLAKANKQRRCPKGKARRKGRCVKKRQGKRRHSSRSRANDNTRRAK